MVTWRICCVVWYDKWNRESQCQVWQICFASLNVMRCEPWGLSSKYRACNHLCMCMCMCMLCVTESLVSTSPMYQIPNNEFNNQVSVRWFVCLTIWLSIASNSRSKIIQMQPHFYITVPGKSALVTYMYNLYSTYITYIYAIPFEHEYNRDTIQVTIYACNQYWNETPRKRRTKRAWKTSSFNDVKWWIHIPSHPIPNRKSKPYAPALTIEPPQKGGKGLSVIVQATRH